MNNRMLSLAWLAVTAFAQTPASSPEAPLRLGIAGLVHNHVDGFFRAIKNRSDVQVVGVFEPDAALQQKYGKKYGLADSVFFTDLNTMLSRAKPEAVALFTSTYDHKAMVEAIAPKHIHVMMEKPLAVSMEHARAMQAAARAPAFT
jgi:Predicted dehydrogenases and related proteins